MLQAGVCELDPNSCAFGASPKLKMLCCRLSISVIAGACAVNSTTLLRWREVLAAIDKQQDDLDTRLLQAIRN
jgi:hypothetical protein